MLIPLQQWICDDCGKLIYSPDAGRVEWMVDAENRRTGFRIVHEPPHSPRTPGGSCGYPQRSGRAEMPLAVLVGKVGMPLILSFLDVGSPRPEHEGPWVENAREFLEFTRRVTLPFYEEARTLWRRAESDGYFDGMSESERYLARTLEVLVKKYGT